MKTVLMRNTHHVNDQNVSVLEVWKKPQEGATPELLVIIPLENDEKVEVQL